MTRTSLLKCYFAIHKLNLCLTSLPPPEHDSLKITLEIMANQLRYVAILTLALLVIVELFQIGMHPGRSQSSITAFTSRVLFHYWRHDYRISVDLVLALDFNKNNLSCNFVGHLYAFEG